MLSKSEIQTIIIDAMDDHLEAYTDGCCGYSGIDGKGYAAESAAEKILNRINNNPDIEIKGDTQ